MWVYYSPEEESKFGNQKVTSWYMQTPNLHVNRMYTWVAKYEIQKPSTCHTTVFCCKFWIDVLHFFTLCDQQFVAGWRKLLWKGECWSTLSNKFSFCCSFFINPPNLFHNKCHHLDPHIAYLGQIAKNCAILRTEEWEGKPRRTEVEIQRYHEKEHDKGGVSHDTWEGGMTVVSRETSMIIYARSHSFCSTRFWQTIQFTFQALAFTLWSLEQVAIRLPW